MDDQVRWTEGRLRTRSRRSRVARGVLVVASCAVVTALGAVPSVATPGLAVVAAAPDAVACEGVSVAIDFGGLGAPGVRGCAEVDPGETVTALDAVRAADVSIEGTAQWGTAFVCRVDGRPAAEEDIELSDGETLREGCARTPSQRAYWSLWHADESEWRYATSGASELELGAGSVVALVFTTGSDEAISPSLEPAEARSGDLPGGWNDRPPAPQTPSEAGTAGRADSTTSADPSAAGWVPLAAVGLILVEIGRAHV